MDSFALAVIDFVWPALFWILVGYGLAKLGSKESKELEQ